MVRENGRKTRILMVLGNTGRGGAQAYAINVLKAIDHTRYHIDFVVNYSCVDGYDETIAKYGGKIYFIPKFNGINILAYKKSWEAILANGNYDIVHGHVSSSAFLYLHIARKYSCITIAHSHSAGYRGNYAIRVIKKMLTAGAKKYADYWFSCSELAAARMFGKSYLSDPRHHFLPNGIWTDQYRFDDTIRHRIRDELLLDDETVLIGHVGTFSRPKNHKFIIEIFSKIVEADHKKAKLILIGDGALRKSIEAEVDRRGLHDRVIFTGNVGNVNEYLMAMDALVFPSLFEGLPVTLLEAQASGLYCVVSDRITKQVVLNEGVVSLPITLEANDWAMKLIDIPQYDREKMWVTVSDTEFNVQRSISTLTSLYDEMRSKRSSLQNDH